MPLTGWVALFDGLAFCLVNTDPFLAVETEMLVEPKSLVSIVDIRIYEYDGVEVASRPGRVNRHVFAAERLAGENHLSFRLLFREQGEETVEKLVKVDGSNI
jgi:hypothetical protein